MSEITLTAENFQKEISGTTPIIVDFWATWCGPCRMLAPEFEKLSKEYDAKKLKFGRCSVEDFPELASRHNVSGIPCMIIFSKGKEVDRIVGFSPKDAIKTKLDAILVRV